jgi:hypothetical protein
VNPQRIQLSRTKGFRKPEGTIVVSRPSKWGNPFVVGEMLSETTGYRIPLVITPEVAVFLFREWLAQKQPVVDPVIVEEDFAELRGHDLACWCPLDQPCHADVLLELANR